MFTGGLSILIVGSLLQAASGLQLPEQYIGWPLERGEFQSGQLDHRLIKDLNFTADSSPEMMMRQFKGIVDAKAHRLSDYRAAESFVELGNGKKDCSFDLEYVFLTKYQAYRTTKKTEKHPEVMINFLEHYGRKKFPACANNAIAFLREDLVKYRDEYARSFNFFKLALSLDKKVSDSRFYTELKRFKPLESEINVGNLAPVCERKTPDESAAERIKRKFDKMCKFIKAATGVKMIILNLADHFAPGKKYFKKYPRIGATNEIRRACLEVEENDRTLLEHLKKFCKPEHDSISASADGLGIVIGEYRY